MVRFIIEFWPVLIPLAVYGIWFFFFRKKGESAEKLSPKEAKLWILTLVASLIIAVICVVVLAVSTKSNKEGEYIPPHMENGKIVPGKVNPNEPQQ